MVRVLFFNYKFRENWLFIYFSTSNGCETNELAVYSCIYFADEPMMSLSIFFSDYETKE